jgi:predicted pyridoxine 5'-phosphate oxidase superfamily flavin-nucleotide-binding protein
MGAFHPGEAAVQERAGAGVQGWGTAHVPAEIPPIAAQFLRAQRMVVVAAVDDGGAAWADLVTGPAGFLDAPDERTITVDAQPALIGGQFTAAERPCAMIAIEPWTRRRVRANGRIRRDADRLVMQTDQVYSNCPKYIQTRTIAPAQPGEPAAAARPSPSGKAAELTGRQRGLISRADTFFIATQAPGLGVDVSHRGGNPGFVTVTAAAGTTRVTWPEYVGNAMYMTLGNLELDPRSGLLFIDWETGRTLHLTGRAVTDWDPDRAAAVPGAQRLVDFELGQAVEVDGGMPLRWDFGEYHRFNPPVGAALGSSE